MGISFLIPTTLDSIPENTIRSVQSQQGLCNYSAGAGFCTSNPGTSYEIIILQNGVSSMPKEVETREIQLPTQYADVPLRKLQIRRKGKGNALNVGIAWARYEYVCVLDADCILDENALQIAMKHFEDKSISAVGGRLKVMSEKGNFLTFCQQVEYIRSFNVLRPLFDMMNADCLISGAYGIFRRSDMELVHGYDADTVGEDMELVLSLQHLLRKGGRCVRYEMDSICYTAVPPTMHRLLRQRDRWQRGLLDCIIKHKELLLNPAYGFLGLVVMPYQFLVELLGPIFILLNIVNLICVVADVQCWFAAIETLKYWLSVEVGIEIHQAWSFYGMYLGVEVFLTCIAVWIEYDRWQMLVMSLPGAIAATGVGVMLSVPLAMARLWGMVSFHWRRMKW